MRLGFNGLYGLVCSRLESDPTNGHLYLFANARRDRMKVLFFDGSGLWVCARRMERGRLNWPAADAGDKIQLTQEEFALLIGGIDLTQTRRRKWYRKPVSEESLKSLKTA